MSKEIRLEDKIGEIVTDQPKTINVFLKYGIDFCCGGHRALGEVIEEEGLDSEFILENLNKDGEIRNNDNEVNYALYSKPELINHIIRTHHDYLRETLPIISGLVNKIYEVHSDKFPNVLSEINTGFHMLKDELESHLVKEEEVLFPLVLKYDEAVDEKEKGHIKKTIIELEEEHEKAGDILKRMNKITFDYKAPTGVCQTYITTYEKLKELELDLYQHIHLENNILFKNIL
ncbi:regulator of cell morphogenesis and NO signaling [Natranaerovirga pectinivora]|uniref:Regulator of cell morphogenesis and NO signaling n=1 Tax=Natranaerovirga pectinivora TaxID=682400 RepID=A0A4R3MG34_9FIRM|nr:iron-sulfur cluster repair di-iron protein [Natranaerovirga pectinivora]TCT12122.1 regulator of cell morphogenesis and NO signaling [Natranaerovirga pectinivora]